MARSTKCEACGGVVPPNASTSFKGRDHNAALNILRCFRETRRPVDLSRDTEQPRLTVKAFMLRGVPASGTSGHATSMLHSEEARRVLSYLLAPSVLTHSRGPGRTRAPENDCTAAADRRRRP